MQKDIFIQARVSSTRLPGKVLKEIEGQPILVRTYNRIRLSKKAHNVVVITSDKIIDEKIVSICKLNNIPVFKGDEKDLLDRHYKAALFFGSKIIFKVPSDCPLSDYKIIDSVLDMSDNYDYVSNYHPPTFPDGLDVEGADFKTLKHAWLKAEKKFEREHTFPFIWDNPKRYHLGNLVNKKGNMFMTHRWTLDYQEDFLFLKKIFKEFDFKNDFDFYDILKLLKKKPKLKLINSKYNGVNWYRNENQNLKTINANLFKNEPVI